MRREPLKPGTIVNNHPICEFQIHKQLTPTGDGNYVYEIVTQKVKTKEVLNENGHSFKTTNVALATQCPCCGSWVKWKWQF